MLAGIPATVYVPKTGRENTGKEFTVFDHYTLRCLGCGKNHHDSNGGFLLQCEEDHGPALLRAEYAVKQLTIRGENPGIFRYKDWLPIRRIQTSTNRPIIFHSEALAEKLRLECLFVAFNGYWPERGAYFETCSFKELEALAVTARVPDSEKRTMVVSSAGNTGMAFLQVCSETGIPVIVVVPATALPSMWITREKHPDVVLAVLEGEVDYFDATELANIIAEQEGFYTEGGTKNAARRDGMGTVVLEAAEAIGRIPDHYVQAIGSGTGGIAAWEMSKRLQEDGRFGSRAMRLHLVQNEPFTIIADAWQHTSPELFPSNDGEARSRIRKVYAGVLSNRRPPYSIEGGIFDALMDTGGFTYTVANDDAREAGYLFNELEGCDLCPAAAVAVAGLCQAVAAGNIGRKDTVLLNITGGGIKKLEQEGRKIPLEPDIIFTKDDTSAVDISAKLVGLRK
ncbi:cysteate synthase [Chloroflexota bacterium]